MARDGDSYAPHWRRWADQEDAYVAAEDPVARADLVVRTATALDAPPPAVSSGPSARGPSLEP
jgi:hypothetical protein